METICYSCNENSQQAECRHYIWVFQIQPSIERWRLRRSNLKHNWAELQFVSAQVAKLMEILGTFYFLQTEHVPNANSTSRSSKSSHPYTVSVTRWFQKTPKEFFDKLSQQNMDVWHRNTHCQEAQFGPSDKVTFYIVRIWKRKTHCHKWLLY